MYHLTVNYYHRSIKHIETENLVLLKDYIKLYRSVEDVEDISVDTTSEECSIPETAYTTHRTSRGGWSKPFNRLPITMRGTRVQE